jgi:hypothetical protein
MVAHPFHYLLAFIHVMSVRICLFPIISHYARELYKGRKEAIELKRKI